MATIFFEVIRQDGELCVASCARCEAQRKGLVDLERRCHDISREIQMSHKRQEIFQNAIEGKLSECKTERAKDWRIKSLKKQRNWYTQRQKKPCK